MSNEMIDKKSIYQNLREEMMDLVKRQDTYLLAAYTITISVWSFAIQFANHWIALLPIFILLPLSFRVCDFRKGTVFLSSFMAIFLERESYDGWEYVREEYFKVFPNLHGEKKGLLENIVTFLSRMSFCLLTIVSIILFWAMRESDFSNARNIIVNSVIIFVQIIIVLLQGSKWYKYADTSKMKKPLMDNWRVVYNTLYSTPEINSVKD